MAILGATGEPTSTAEAHTGSTESLHGQVLTFPAGGPWLVQSVSVWCAGYGIDTPARNVVWIGSSGAVVAYSDADHTLVARAFTNTGSDLYTRNVYSNGPGHAAYTIPGGSVVIAGFQRQEASYGAFFGKLATGSHRDKIAAAYLESMASNTTDSSGDMGVYITYIAANAAPNAPTLLTPSGGVIITGADLTPALSFLYDDPDGNPMSAYQVQVSTVSDFASTVWDSGKTALVQADNTTVIVSPTTSLVRGTLYYWRARVYDNSDAVSGWSA